MIQLGVSEEEFPLVDTSEFKRKYGLPDAPMILFSDQCGFGEIKSIDTRLEVPATVAGLAAGMTSLLSEAKTLDDISQSWSSFVKQRYSWSSLVPEYFKLYSAILSRSSSETIPPVGKRKAVGNSKR